jgi:hypothetical protein
MEVGALNELKGELKRVAGALKTVKQEKKLN